MNAKLAGPILWALVLFTCGALASIEREPVKVDRANAGPKYDIDELERTRVLSEVSNIANQVMSGPAVPTARRAEAAEAGEASSRQDSPIITVRRIFLVPMAPSSAGDSEGERASDPIRMFGMPPRSLFSPFGSRPLFGADEASRPAPVNPDESQERPVLSSSSSDREQESGERPRPASALFDPIEMLIEAMRQALNPANMMPSSGDGADLNKEASGENKPETGLEGVEANRKSPAQSYNSTKEDVVEIDGKKYLRKTVINRHVGDGIMFTTRRLIFSPLNETDTEPSRPKESSAATTTTTTTTTTSSTTSSPTTTEWTLKVDEPTGSSSASAGSEPASSTESAASEPTPASPSTATTEADKEETTKSVGEKIGDAVSKVERLLEKAIERKEEPSPTSSSTEKPSA